MAMLLFGSWTVSNMLTDTFRFCHWNLFGQLDQDALFLLY